MKTPAELARRLRLMVVGALHHYSPQGEPLRSIVVTPDWLDDMADAAHLLEQTAEVVALCEPKEETLHQQYMRQELEKQMAPMYEAFGRGSASAKKNT